MNIVDFISDPWEAETRIWWDPDADAVASQCPTCGAEARHKQDQLMDFLFRHAPACPIGLRVVPGQA